MALLMGLVLLAAISLMALMAANGTVLQRRMSANFEASSKALGDAARATAAARAWLDSRSDFERQRGCLSNCILPAAIQGTGELPRYPEFESAAWWMVNAVAAGTHPETGDAVDLPAPEADPPRWIIEELRYVPLDESVSGDQAVGVGYYRILARSSGGRAGGLAITESIVARPWDGDYEPLPYPSDTPPGAFCRQFDQRVACGMQAWRQRR